jgi:hypothetical protein
VSGGVNRFYNSIEAAANLAELDLVGFFMYYLTVELAQESALAKEIDACFIACDLTPPSRTARYLSEGVPKNRFVKANSGYKLHRHYRDEISGRLGAERVVVQASAELRKLDNSLNAGPTKDFLKETIDCFEAGANRATVVMSWILAMHHLIEYTIAHRLGAFNAVLAANTDKRVKVSVIASRDDFGDIPEGKLIEFLRSARVIDNDVRKILDQKLGTRNTYAHPSAITITRTKAIEFVEDLVNNVVLKYRI